MQARSADIQDVSSRLLRILRGEEEKPLSLPFPVILAADDLRPSETVQLDKKKLLAIVTSEGSRNSHTAILARTMGIPAIVRLGGRVHRRHERQARRGGRQRRYAVDRSHGRDL